MSAGYLSARRRCLAGLLAVLGAVGAGPFVRSCVLNAADDSRRALLAVLDDPRKARAIGLAYLRTVPPAERTAEHLVRALYADAALETGAAAWPNLAHLINERVRRDFSAGTMVAVDGWFLALTEARLYALATFA